MIDYTDAEFLKRKLIDEGYTIRKLAEECYCSKTALVYWVHKSLLNKYPEYADTIRKRSRRYRGFDKELYEKIKAIRESEGLSFEKIGKRVGVCGKTARLTYNKGRALYG